MSLDFEELLLFDMAPPIAQSSRQPYTREQIIEEAFAHYRRVGFPGAPIVEKHDALLQINALSAVPTDELTHSLYAYHVADRYQPHRFMTHVDKKPSAFDQFERDEYLRHSLTMALDRGRITDTTLMQALAMCRGAQLPAQFRPGFALQLMRRYAPDDAVIFDPSTGYGGRIVGWLASTAREYVGVDPNVPTHEGNVQMLADLMPADRSYTLLNYPAEDVLGMPDKLALFEGRCDFSLSSPPYFSKERYSEDDTQSWVRYSTPDVWRHGFLEPYLMLVACALKPGGKAAINVADVKMGKVSVPLVAWTKQAGIDAGLTYLHTDLFPMPRVPTRTGDVQQERFESVHIFESPADDSAPDRQPEAPVRIVPPRAHVDDAQLVADEDGQMGLLL